MKRFFFLILILIWASGAHAQQKYTISGYVKDKGTGEGLISASIYIVEAKQGTVTNPYGHYSITLPQANYTIRVMYVGYQTYERKLSLTANTTVNIQLESEEKEVGEVVVSAHSNQSQVEKTQMSTINLPVEQVKQLPALFGEVDILKTIQLLPGVQSGGEGSTGFYVRGGGPDQNLILLDEATVYNASHLFGFFSVFNADAIRNVELYKGGFPAQFGGRLSSVVDISLKDGNNQKYQVEGGIGLIASRLTVEGPIKKGKSSFIISGRRTYLDVFTNMINRANKNNTSYNPIPSYFFYDLNAKVNYELSDRDRLYLSGYFGRDVFNFNRANFNFGFNWGNATTTARWNHLYNPKLFQNTTASYTNYQYTIASSTGPVNFSIGSHIQDYTLKTDYDWSLSPKHAIKFGASGVWHDFGVGRVQISSSDNSLNLSQDNTLQALELGVYGSDDWTVDSLLKITYGLRISGFDNKGTFYSGVEPRASARYLVGKRSSVKLSYAKMNQYVHLVSSSGGSLPTDIWYPSTNIVKPQISQQVAAGYTTLVDKQRFVLSDEVFYKWMQNQIDYRNGAQIFLNPNLDHEFVFGKGWSYGNEIYLEKKEGKLTGWIGYTLAWSYRQYDSINNGKKFFPRYDRRHDISIVASYAFNKRITFSATWVYYSGNYISLPTGWIYLNNISGAAPIATPIYGTRDNYRMAPYHRLDLSLVWKFYPKWGTSDLTFSVYNAYNRLNPYLVYIDQSVPTEGLPIPTGATAKQISLFPIIPAVTYNFKF
jgi:hypothetical protein